MQPALSITESSTEGSSGASLASARKSWWPVSVPHMATTAAGTTSPPGRARSPTLFARSTSPRPWTSRSPSPSGPDPSVRGMALHPGHVRGGLGSSLEVELGQDRTDVVLDSLVRQEHLGRDLLVGLAFRHEREDLAFLLRQGCKLVVVGRDPAHALQDLAGHRRVEQRAAAGHRLEGGDEITGPHLLEE